MKLLNFSVVRIIVALVFVFSITANVFAFYHKDGNWLVCDYCGARHINAFPKDGHYAWCKYAPAQSSSSSSKVYVPKTTSSSSDYAAASVATLALGSMISDLISSSSKPAKTPQQIAAEKEKQEKEKMVKDLRSRALLKDMDFWKSGDYIIKEGDLKFEGAKAYGVYNKKTQKWVLSADKQKDNEGRIVVFRDFKKDNRDDGDIRLLSCKNENSSYTKTLVYIDYANEYYKKKKTWTRHYGQMFFVINDNDELEKLNKSRIYNFFVNQNGKCGVVDIVEDSVGSSDFCGYKIIVPVEYDSVEIFNNFEDELNKANMYGVFCTYLAKKKDDIYLFDSKGERLSPKLAEYDSITEFSKNDFYMVSKNNKFGAVNGNDNILVPFIYSDPFSFYGFVDDVIRTVSFTNWYKNKVKPYLTTKSKYEKEADFQARMNDPKKQEQYVAEKMKNAGKDYIDEFKDKVSIELGSYDAETEKFIIKENVNLANAKRTLSTCNIIELSVPIKEAEAFEKNFKNMNQDALKNATYGICYDLIAVAKTTFKMPNGKTYTFDSTKNGK